MSKTVTILGSTGSVGQSVVKVLKEFGNGNFIVSALVAYSDHKALAKQAIDLKAKFVGLQDASNLTALKELLAGHKTKVMVGDTGIKEICQMKTDIVVIAIPGFASIMPTYYSILSGSKSIIIASKEALVCGGRILKECLARAGNQIIPIDSEHNAIFQIFEQKNRQSIESITLTGSGGPFRKFSKATLNKVTAAQALKHPKWEMGKKITIDSATLFNKGLEIIEAHYLFDVPMTQIKVVIQPECIMHGLVQYKDGSMLAHMAYPDMRIPILHAFYWPTRYCDGKSFKPLDLDEIKNLAFEPVNEQLFPAIKLCRRAFEMGEQAVLMLNTANEIAVRHFLAGKIKFLDIFKIIEGALRIKFTQEKIQSMDDIVALESESRLKIFESTPLFADKKLP